jgi:putative colanic acid biosynthesis acetyltransferase WcaF
LADVVIEDNVCISQGAMLLCGNHNYKKETFDLMIGKIIVKEGAWIGARAVVCSGVIVNAGAVLTVSSVATKDLDTNSIYQGIPAIKIRMINRI